MKAKLFAALLAGSPWLTPATSYADDSGTQVTLYGVVDAGLVSTHTSGVGTSTGILNGGLTDSLWGLRGREDIGNGWAANFQLESGFNPSNGQMAESGRLFNYGAWVGLSNADYGDMRLGRQYTVGKTFGNMLETASWKEMGMGATFKASDNYQFSNVVNYYSPDFAGFQLGVGYSFSAAGDERFATNNNNRAISTGLKYENGPLLAVLTWDQLYLAQEPARGAGGRPQAVQLGVAYDFEVVKLAAAWSRQRNGYVGLDGGDPDSLGLGLGPAAFVQGGTINAWLLGASVPVGPGAVVLQWSLADPNWQWSNGESAKKAQVVTAGYTYNMSPRTTLYGFVGYMSNYTTDEQFDPANSHTTRVGMGVSHRF